MKAYMFILPFITAMHSTASAQAVTAKSIEDSVIGWMKVYKFTGPRTPITVDAKHYSAAQLSITDSLANWMQASYTPKGALGDVIRFVSPKLNVYTKNNAALPQSYGADAKSYYELKYNSSHKLEPLTASHLSWSIRANGAVGEPLLVLNTPAQYYFLLPGFGNRAARANPLTERYNLVDHPALKRYITYFDDQFKTGNYDHMWVLLSKDNKVPFVKISKAEYLDKLAGALERKHVAEQEYATRSWPEGKARTSALEDVENRYAKRVSLLGSNRERYASRLQEAAEVFSIQPDALLENYKDVFEGSGGPGERYPVYKLDPVMADLATTDKPQWIVVRWDGDLLAPLGKQHHDAIVNNFDLQYLYDYFFAPEKIGGRPYKPLRSPDFKAAVVVTEASEATRSNTSNANVHFFEDFSTTDIGRTPTGWSNGENESTIATLDGLPGKWAMMAGNASLTSKQMKRPLPQNFTLTYELVATQNYPWGAKGLTLQLANERSPGNAESYIRLKLRPGFDGRDGEAMIETKFPSGYLSGSKWMPATGFSNDKQNNRITVSIRKSGETMQLFIDANKIAEYDKAMPAGQLFNAMSFGVPGSSSALKDKFYLGKIRISKD